MSDLFDVLLRDPSEADLVDAFVRATSKQSERLGRSRWKTQIDEVTKHAEGDMPITCMTDPIDRTFYLLLSWWSDHCGGKHVRLRGGDKVNLRTHLSLLDRDERPPLWQVFPEYVYLVKRGEAKPQWLASCPCGVTGLPRNIAWMGPRCGPCHDRREEGDFGVVSERKTILREGAVVDALAFSPDKETVAAVIGKEHLVEIRPSVGERSLYGDPSDEPTRISVELAPLTYSPDGRWLAFGDAAAGQVVLLDMTNDQMIYLALEDGHTQDVTDLSFSPVGDHLVACDHSRQGRLFRWTGSLWAEVKSFRGATAVAISEDGQKLAIGGSGGAIRFYSTDSGAKRGQVTTGARSEESVLFLAWTPRDEALILLTGLEDRSRGEKRQQQLRRWDVARRRETHCTAFGESALLALSQDARYLASIHHDDQHSPSAIQFWDLLAWHDVGWIEWDPEDAIHALAFSPDNETLVIGTHHGRIKLVPWRQLLLG